MFLNDGLALIPCGVQTSLSFASIQSPRIWHISNLPITCSGSSPRWSWNWLVSHSTCSYIRIWTEPVWIKWCDECVWHDIPVECQVEGMSNEQDTFDEVQDHRWVLVYSPLSLCPWNRSSLHISSFHLNTCLPSVLGRMEGQWICHGVVWMFWYHTRWSICTCQMCWVILPIWSDFDWSSPSPILVEETHQFVRQHSMHDSSIQVVRIEIVDAFIARSCLLLIVNIVLCMLFHHLSDPSSKILQ